MSSDFQPFGGLGPAEVETPPAKKRVRKVADLSLDDLYQRAEAAGKVTPSIRKAIIEKEDFSRIQPRFCSLACGLCASSRRPAQVKLCHDPVDIAVIQDHNALPDKYKSSEQQEGIYRDIIGFLATRYFQGLSVRVLNTLKCLPQSADLRGANVTVTKLKPCAPYLHREIAEMKPKVVIVLSTASLGALGMKLSSSRNRGEIHQTDFGPIVVTLHPKVLTMIRQNASGKDWGPDYFEVIERDFEKAARIARGDLKIVSLDEALAKASLNIRIARSLEDVREMTSLLSSLPVNKVLSFDLETTGLDAWSKDAKILTAQFGYTDPESGEPKALVFPLWHRRNLAYPAEAAWEYIAPILLDDHPKVGHNIKFDIIYTFVNTGVRVKNAVFDTLLLLHAINSGLKNNFSLKKGVWDFLPETGLGGYEDKLPALTKGVDDGATDDTETEDDE